MRVELNFIVLVFQTSIFLSSDVVFSGGILEVLCSYSPTEVDNVLVQLTVSGEVITSGDEITITERFNRANIAYRFEGVDAQYSRSVFQCLAVLRNITYASSEVVVIVLNPPPLTGEMKYSTEGS